MNVEKFDLVHRIDLTAFSNEVKADVDPNARCYIKNDKAYVETTTELTQIEKEMVEGIISNLPEYSSPPLPPKEQFNWSNMSDKQKIELMGKKLGLAD